MKHKKHGFFYQEEKDERFDVGWYFATQYEDLEGPYSTMKIALQEKKKYDWFESKKYLVDFYGKKVQIEMETGSLYYGNLGGIQQATNKLKLHNLCIINKRGGVTTSGGNEGRWFNINKIKKIEVEEGKTLKEIYHK